MSKSAKIYILVLLLAYCGIISQVSAAKITSLPVLNDPGISALVSPSTTGCYGPGVPVVVTIQNFGSNSLTSIPVNVIVSGPVSQTLSLTFTGVLAAGASTNFTVGNANMSYGGVYTFSSTTALIGDGNNNNNNFVTTRTVTPNVFISGPSSACLGNTVTLFANGASSYTWSTGDNTGTIAVSPTVSTSYSVIGTNTAGCSAIYMVTLSVENPTITGINTTACGSPANGTLSANAFSPAIVTWYDSPTSTLVLSTGSNFPVSGTATATYYAEAASTSSGSLFTTKAGGNAAQGNMFNISALTAFTIEGVDMHFNGNVTTTVEIWYRPGTFVGFETSNSGWTQVLSTTLIPAGTGTLSTIPGTFAIPVAMGQTVGIYVTANGGAGVNYSNGSSPGNLYAANPDISLYEGKGGNYFNVTSSPRVFNGVLKYRKPGCQSPRVPATFSVVPGFTVTAARTHSALCSGSSVTLTAGGAIDYTWTPNENISPSPNSTVIIASPTVYTTYTLTGSIPSCTQISTFTVDLTVIPAPTLNISPPVGVLPGSILTLTVGGAFTYTWFPGGSNNTSILIFPSATTVYTVVGTNQFGCTSSITTTVAISAVGINEQGEVEEETLLFPNPANGNVTVISGFGGTDCFIEMFDQQGKLVYSKQLSGKESQLDISYLAGGIYTYRVLEADKKTLLKKGKLIRH